jgi:hypothetical protein
MHRVRDKGHVSQGSFVSIDGVIVLLAELPLFRGGYQRFIPTRDHESRTEEPECFRLLLELI